MRSPDYRFITHWRVKAMPGEVYDLLSDSAQVATWWPQLYRKVEVVMPGDAHGVGKIVNARTRGFLPYTLRWSFRLTESHYPNGFSLEVWGDLTGTGTWDFMRDGDHTNVTYHWNVRGDKVLLKYFSFFLRPLFRINHDYVMKKGEEGLRGELLKRQAYTISISH